MIKKLILTTFFGLFLTIGNTQVFQKNNIILDVYYGFPNWYTLLNDGQYTGISGTVNNVKGIGPLGIKGEFMLSDLIGLGFDAGVNQSRITEDYNYYNAFNGNIVPGTIESRTQKIGGIVTFNFHPLKGGDKFDIAVVAGLGYGKRTYQTTFSHPQFLSNTGGGTNVFGVQNSDEYNFFTDDDNFLGAVTFPFPLAFRIGMNFRYFFTPNIGINMNVGAAHGGILNGGITAKF